MFLLKIKKDIAEELNINIDDIVYPPNSELGDFSLAVFKLAEKNNKGTSEMAIEMKEKVFDNFELKEKFSDIKIIGPYLNFFLKKDFLFSQIILEILEKADEYGYNQNRKKEMSVFEYSNINTHKDFHIGHLRNICLGDAIYRVSLANGFKAAPVSYINDFGIHVARAIWSYKKKYSDDIAKCYTNTVKEVEKNPEIIKEISSIMSDIEKRRGSNYKLWKKTRKISLKKFDDIYDKLNVKFEKTYFESELISKGLKMLVNFTKKGIFRKSEGAIIADLNEYDLGVLPIIRSDGTALYPVADLALAKEKSKNFKNLKNSFVIVDVRQSLYFKQLFKILSLAGYEQNFKHLSYEFVTLPEGMMSSRSGNAISFDELYQKVFERLFDESRKRHEDWSRDKIENNCRKLSVAILKFEMLKVSASKIISFDIKEALRFDGFNALYILYGLVRVKSILRKSSIDLKREANFELLKEKEERKIILELAKYPEMVIKTEKEKDPSEIAKYSFDLFRLFNEYYQKIKVLSDDREVQRARLALLGGISQVAENSLSLLGIESLDEI
jgi:arginyl-tRNA synthetase